MEYNSTNFSIEDKVTHVTHIRQLPCDPRQLEQYNKLNLTILGS